MKGEKKSWNILLDMIGGGNAEYDYRRNSEIQSEVVNGYHPKPSLICSLTDNLHETSLSSMKYTNIEMPPPFYFKPDSDSFPWTPIGIVESVI